MFSVTASIYNFISERAKGERTYLKRTKTKFKHKSFSPADIFWCERKYGIVDSK